MFLTLMLIGLFVIETYAQTWRSKYSADNFMDSGIHGYSNWSVNNPWKVADNLIKKDTLNSYQMGMKVDSATVSGNVLTVVTTGARFKIYKSNTSKHIEIYQKLVQPLAGTRPNPLTKVVELQFLTSSGTPIAGVDYTGYNMTSGRLYFKDIDEIELRINGDGLLMIKPIGSYIDKVKYKFNFYPGYVATSPQIKKFYSNESAGGNDDYNKKDVSRLFMDEYGGFGVYLLDNEKEHYDTTVPNVPPSATYKLTSNQVFWTAVFPPKAYNFSDAKAQKRIARSNWYSYISTQTIGGGQRLIENPWNSNSTDPMNTFWLVSNTKPNVLTDSLNDRFNNELDNGYFIYFGDMALWQYWHYGYVPRRALNSSAYSLLKKVLDNLHASSLNMKGMVYTSPQFFIKGSRYGPANNPFPAAGGWNNPDYNYMTNNINSFTFDNGKQVRLYSSNLPPLTVAKIPILNNYDMLWYIQTGTLPVDNFMRALVADPNEDYPPGVFPTTSREGENMWDFLSAIKTLKDSCQGKLDGIYMDTFYEFNVARTYQLMRELKKKHGDNFLLFRHASAKEGQDAYLPQIDAYADFVLTGEGRENLYNDRQFLRFFASTYNISNSVAVVSEPKVGVLSSITNTLLDNNLRIWYTSIKRDVTVDTTISQKVTEADIFLDVLTNNLGTQQSRVENNISFHQPFHEQKYDIDEWWYSPSWGTNTNDKPLAGDFNGDGKSDIAIFRTTNPSTWYVSISSGSSFGLTTWVPLPYGITTDKPLTGDFNGDNKEDILLFRPSTDEWFIRFTKEDGSAFGGSSSESYFTWGVDTNEEVLVGDFNADGKDDLVRYKAGQWNVLLSKGGYNWGNTDWSYSWGNTTGDKPLVGDFNGDGIDDIAIFRTSGTSAQWLVSKSTGQGFQNLSWSYNWGNKTGDEPLIGDFDGTRFEEIMIHRTSSYPNWFVSLSSGTQFVTPNPYWDLSYGNLSADTPVIADYNGDGVDDIAIHRAGQTPSWIVNRIKPGEIRSSATGMLPKTGGQDRPDEIVPIIFALHHNFPNPFNPVTTIRYSIPSKTMAKLEIYDILGRRVQTLVNEEKDIGHYSVQFDGTRYASGVYFYKLSAGRDVQVKKMLFLK